MPDNPAFTHACTAALSSPFPVPVSFVPKSFTASNRPVRMMASSFSVPLPMVPRAAGLALLALFAHGLDLAHQPPLDDAACAALAAAARSQPACAERTASPVENSQFSPSALCRGALAATWQQFPPYSPNMLSMLQWAVTPTGLR